MGLRPGSHSVFERKLYTQLEARLPTGCGWSQTYQQDDAEYDLDATCCALCLGAMDYHSCGRVLGVWEFGWDCFLYILLLCVSGL